MLNFCAVLMVSQCIAYIVLMCR